MADNAESSKAEPSAADGSKEGEPKPGVVRRAKNRIHALRERRPVVDHAVRAYQHMSAVQGTILAGAVTYFGYLSFFPVLVIAFAVVTKVAEVVPAARNGLVTAVESIFPGLIGDGRNAAINIDTFADQAAAVGFIALLGLFYSGLGWISAARAGLQGVFQVPPKQRRNFALGKLVDLLMLAVIGTVLILSVGMSSAVTTVTRDILVLLQFDEIPGDAMIVLLKVVAVALGVVASTVLFFTMFMVLPAAGLPRSAVLKGAFVAALGFEVLKLLASTLISLAAKNPATAVLGISLVLLVWINYFSQVIMAGAAWAYTSPEARAIRDRQAERQRTRAELAERRRRRRERYGRRRRLEQNGAPLEPAAQRRVDRLSLAAGATVGATATALVGVVRRRH
jgi:membrane protein